MSRPRGLHRREALNLLGGLALAPLAACTAGAPQPPARPRLIVTPAELARARAEIARDPLAAEIYEALLDQGDRLLATPPTAREFEEKRPVLLLTSRRVLHRVRTLGGLWLLTGDTRYAARAKAELDAAAAFPDWNPAHFLDTAEMAHGFAIGLDWLDGALAPGERARLVAALVEKGIEPGLAGFARGDFWTRANHNWNLVCNGGLALAALAIARDMPEPARALLDRCVAAASTALASYGPDGAWNEGPSYWSYATDYATVLIAGLESVHGPSALAATPGFAETGLFALHFTGPTGLTFNFADADEENYSGPYLFWLSRRFDRPLYAGYYRPRVGEEPGIFDLLWYDPRSVSPREADVPACAYFRHAEVAMLRGSWHDPKTTWVAVKGGDNAANHSHLDLGTFVLECGGARFAVDLGGDDYALPGYFDMPQRFTYYRAASHGHNLLLPDGRNQGFDARARITAFDPDPDHAHAVVDLDAAWPALAAARRGIALLGGRHVAIADEIDRREPLPWTWQMHTRARTTLRGADATLRQNGAVLYLRIVEPRGSVFALEPVHLAPPQLPANGVSRLLIRFPPRRGPLRVTVLASPDPGAAMSHIARARRPLAAWAKPRTSS